jgi:hypothetical protein
MMPPIKSEDQITSPSTKARPPLLGLEVEVLLLLGPEVEGLLLLLGLEMEPWGLRPVSENWSVAETGQGK